MAWNNRDGFPAVCNFISQRLFFAGSVGFPATLWGSVVGDAFNFLNATRQDDNADEALVEADYGITRTLDSYDEIYEIRNENETLILTAGGEYSISGEWLANDAGKLISRRSSAFGSTANLGAAVIDEQIFFASRTAAISLYYDGTFRGWNPINVSAFRNEDILMRRRADGTLSNFAAREDGTDNTAMPLSVKRVLAVQQRNLNGAYLVLYLMNDGTLRCFHTLYREEFFAWSRWDFDDAVSDMCAVDDDVVLMGANGIYRLEPEQFWDDNGEAAGDDAAKRKAVAVRLRSPDLAMPQSQGATTFNKKKLNGLYIDVFQHGELTLTAAADGDRESELVKILPRERVLRPEVPFRYEKKLNLPNSELPWYSREDLYWELTQEDAAPFRVMSVGVDFDAEPVSVRIANLPRNFSI